MLNEKSLKWKKLNNSFANVLYNMQQDVFDELKDKSLLRYNDLNTFKDCMENHFTLGLFSHENLIAFGILYFHSLKEQLINSLQCYSTDFRYLLKSNSKYKRNYYTNFSFSYQFKVKIATIKLIIVKKEFRGNHYQRCIIQKLEQQAKKLSYKILICSVSPDNIYSLNNFLLENYRIVDNKLLYGGLKRFILVKRL